jgi:hypothetical protein
MATTVVAAAAAVARGLWASISVALSSGLRVSGLSLSLLRAFGVPLVLLLLSLMALFVLVGASQAYLAPHTQGLGGAAASTGGGEGDGDLGEGRSASASVSAGLDEPTRRLLVSRLTALFEWEERGDDGDEGQGGDDGLGADADEDDGPRRRQRRQQQRRPLRRRRYRLPPVLLFCLGITAAVWGLARRGPILAHLADLLGPSAAVMARWAGAASESIAAAGATVVVMMSSGGRSNDGAAVPQPSSSPPARPAFDALRWEAYLLLTLAAVYGGSVVIGRGRGRGRATAAAAGPRPPSATKGGPLLRPRPPSPSDSTTPHPEDRQQQAATAAGIAAALDQSLQGAIAAHAGGRATGTGESHEEVVRRTVAPIAGGGGGGGGRGPPFGAPPAPASSAPAPSPAPAPEPAAPSPPAAHHRPALVAPGSGGTAITATSFAFTPPGFITAAAVRRQMIAHDDFAGSPGSALSAAYSFVSLGGASSASGAAAAVAAADAAGGFASSSPSSSSSLLLLRGPTGDPELDRARADAAEHRLAARRARRETLLGDMAVKAGMRADVAVGLARRLEAGAGGGGGEKMTGAEQHRGAGLGGGGMR